MGKYDEEIMHALDGDSFDSLRREMEGQVRAMDALEELKMRAKRKASDDVGQGFTEEE